ncbi:MAG: type I-E CRISPR-associated protein Cse1/CasA [Bryobacterales bacterium]|nr:type I-E CRISPR-associated protein Cse1/CasA [Bryobacterales bacterium]
MNLTTEAWIPVVWNNGRPGTVSLREAFEAGHEIRDLAVRPHERIALMRLLICIAQAALDGPNDEEDWANCRSKIGLESLTYLRNWHAAFELLGDLRFLQVKGDGQLGKMDLDKLDFVDADTTTLFNHDVGTGRQRTLERVALGLVTYQSFAAGGTVGGSIELAGRLQSQKGKNGPCRDRSAFHAFIRRENLVSTVHANLVAKQSISDLKNLDWGVPVWEARATTLSELRKIGHFTKSYLGRLVPVSRAIWLQGDGATALNANGLAYPSYAAEGIRDPTTSVRVTQGKDRRKLRVLLSAVDGRTIKKPWRELHALTVKRISDQGAGGPLALANLDDDEAFDLWVGALVASGAKIAKIEDTVESSYAVFKGMLSAPTQRAYEAGVHHAEHWLRRLRCAIGIYRLAMETNEATSEGPKIQRKRLKTPQRQRAGDIAGTACSIYWTLVEHRLELLNSFALEPIPTLNGKMQYYETDWGKHVRWAAGESYKYACAHETPRQIRAYALGLRTLHTKNADTQPKGEEEAES